MKQKLIVIMAALALLAFAAACEVDQSDAIKEEAVNYFARNYPEKSAPWTVCAVGLFTEEIETESDVQLFNEYDEYKMFTLTTIEETCDSAVAQSDS